MIYHYTTSATVQPLQVKGSSRGSLQAGFTMVEVLVVMTIMAIMTSIVVFSHGNFQEHMNLSNEAQELKLAIRQAQTRALAVEGQGGDFQVGYGLHFRHESQQGEEGTDSYRLYYFEWEDDELAVVDKLYGVDENYVMISENELEHSTIIEIKGEGYRWNSGARSNWSVFFERPRPTAQIVSYNINENGKLLAKTERGNIEIILESSQGNFHQKLTVTSAGQISLNPHTPND